MIKLYFDGTKFFLGKNSQVMYRRIEQIKNDANEQKKKRRPNANGKMAEYMAIIELYNQLQWVGSPESSNLLKTDFFAASPEQPAVACIQVKSLFGNNHIVHLYAEDLESDSNLVYIIVVESKPKHYEYLVLTQNEICSLASKLTLQVYPNRRPDFNLSIPKSLQGFEQYKNAWHKISENALVPQRKMPVAVASPKSD